jgi:hypothetical protein
MEKPTRAVAAKTPPMNKPLMRKATMKNAPAAPKVASEKAARKVASEKAAPKDSLEPCNAPAAPKVTSEKAAPEDSLEPSNAPAAPKVASEKAAPEDSLEPSNAPTGSFEMTRGEMGWWNMVGGATAGDPLYHEVVRFSGDHFFK